jgi:hypothetical protein
MKINLHYDFRKFQIKVLGQVSSIVAGGGLNGGGMGGMGGDDLSLAQQDTEPLPPLPADEDDLNMP